MNNSYFLGLALGNFNVYYLHHLFILAEAFSSQLEERCHLACWFKKHLCNQRPVSGITR